MSDSNATLITVPLVATRGIVLFPDQDVMIEVARKKSVNAVNEAGTSYNGMVFVVCQKDIRVENPTEDSLYTVGTLAKIKIVRKKEGFYRVTFSGSKRARIVKLMDSPSMMQAEIETLEDGGNGTCQKNCQRI